MIVSTERERERERERSNKKGGVREHGGPEICAQALPKLSKHAITMSDVIMSLPVTSPQLPKLPSSNHIKRGVPILVAQ